MPKAMRSTKTGSTCADCGAEIGIGDPIVYFGPGRVYGLTCHENEKTKRYLRQLEVEETGGEERGQRQEQRQGQKSKQGPQPRPGGVLKVETAQEWVMRFEWTAEAVKDPTEVRWLQLMLRARYCGQLVGALNVLEFRAPRSIGVVATKRWAETVAAEFNVMIPVEWGRAEAAPLLVEGGLVEPPKEKGGTK